MRATLSSWRWQTAFLFTFAIIMAWQVLSHSFAAYLAPTAPRAALWLEPQQPVALLTLADQALNRVATKAMSTGTEPPSGRAADIYQNLNQYFSAFEAVGQNGSVTRPFLPDNADAIRGWAEAALLHAPLDAHALQLLGHLAEARGDDAGAAKFMRAAARLSLREYLAIFWLMRRSVEEKDYKSAIDYADVLLRTNPELAPEVVPVLGYVAQYPAGVDLLENVLASNPPWRAQFFALFPRSVTDARTPLALLAALRKAARPPTVDEVGSYVDFLVGRKLFGLAYYTWLQFLPPEELRNAGLLYNGGFESTPSGLPFDWQIEQGSGVTVDIVSRSDKDGGHALLVDFQYGRVDYHSVTELIMLSPGSYQFSGDYRGTLEGPRGLKWRIVCADVNSTLIGESAMIMGMAPTWRKVGFTFTIPATGCRAQSIRLDLDARMASEELVSGSMLFDDLKISRVANSPS